MPLLFAPVRTDPPSADSYEIPNDNGLCHGEGEPPKLGMKGDHRHVLGAEERYNFTDPDALLADFWRKVEEWRR
jgi:hypothetical protein